MATSGCEKSDGFCRSRQNVSLITERRYRRYGYQRWKSQTGCGTMLQSSFTEVVRSRAARLSVLRINDCFDDPGGQTLLGGLGAGCGEQHRDLRDRSSNQAIRICSCQPFLPRSLRGKPAHLAQGGTLDLSRRLREFPFSRKKERRAARPALSKKVYLCFIDRRRRASMKVARRWSSWCSSSKPDACRLPLPSARLLRPRRGC